MSSKSLTATTGLLTAVAGKCLASKAEFAGGYSFFALIFLSFGHPLMHEDIPTQLALTLLKSVEAAIATDDMLAMLCIHFANASPGPALAFADSLKGIREFETFDKTSSFVALAKRMESALRGDMNLKFLSLTNPAPTPATPDELRVRLRVIQGGRS
jgi:hypothetical protein